MCCAFSAMGCSDTWDEHYGEENRIVSNQSLLQLVKLTADWEIS